jgi:hypothetical protein
MMRRLFMGYSASRHFGAAIGRFHFRYRDDVRLGHFGTEKDNQTNTQ